MPAPKVTSLREGMASAWQLPPRGLLTADMTQERGAVDLADAIRNLEARGTEPTLVPLGLDPDQRHVATDLAKLPHLLVAGVTGSGTSHALHTMLITLLMRATPDQIRLVLIDTRRAELACYDGVAHNLFPVVTSLPKAAEVLAWVECETQRRADDLAGAGFRTISAYNAAITAGKPVPLRGRDHEYRPYPYMIVAMDDLGDLMRSPHGQQASTAIRGIASLGRIVGVNMVGVVSHADIVSAPSAVVAAFPSRLAFSGADSARVLDMAGVRRLPVGDALFKPLGAPRPARVHLPFVDGAAIDAVAGHCRVHPDYAALAKPNPPPKAYVAPPLPELIAAASLVVGSQFGSTSMVQRKLRVGFSRAGWLMDELERRGIVGPSQGAKAREVLVNMPTLETLMQSWAQDAPPNDTARG